MGRRRGSKEYSQVSLDDFSDDDSSHGGDDDFVRQSIRNQQVRTSTRDVGLVHFILFVGVFVLFFQPPY